ncbi:FAD-binding oxidoreductase [Kingella kingae]|uniref:D-lactate dehydrogenase (Cytochrome) n=3 Tax=Kingella kingae TaxID=504 RepID=F5S9X8_KINKI|nr:FAD-binding oxidoreductase [Kingella kingae]EGK06890.1 D-lactate dehydrogenase (cytochrome) [Kingella kingae ATCC 23330]MDK4534011.1 FAD-binding oxidoreductase [Kingella kingae]MDK4540402.1 FAD-binding oxidoreductase [Kingella kingae]MDK4553075.1 FAD-binding oxidoreductase [Kingella kingae]MDK4608681.1 FAD-binding oxidoreductase [Kingella kingae]
MYTELRALLSPNELPSDTAPFLLDQRKRYTSTDCLVVQPNSVQSVQKIVRFCAARDITITPQGGNTGLVGGSVAQGGVLLNLSKLNRIRHVNLADNTITVDAGCILHNVQAAAAEANRFFPLSLASEGSCQIGGNIACNAGGLNVLRYGTMRDLVVGLEVVLPNGELLSHLNPLHKNTTAYELKHLFIGSEGTLGIITGATLKLFAPPQSTETAWVGINSIQSAVQLLSLVKNQFAERLCSFELVSQFALNLSAQHSHIVPSVQAAWHVLIELTDSLARDDLGDLLADFLYTNGYENSVLAQSEQERQDLWTLRENISASQRALGASIKHDIAMPIVAVADFVEQCGAELIQHYPDMDIVVFGHLGDGSLHYNTFLPNVLSNDVYQHEDTINQIVYRHTLQQNGTIAAEHGIGSLKRHWLPSVRSPAEIALMKAIKAQLDPQQLFNPHKLLPD